MSFNVSIANFLNRLINECARIKVIFLFVMLAFIESFGKIIFEQN